MFAHGVTRHLIMSLSVDQSEIKPKVHPVKAP